MSSLCCICGKPITGKGNNASPIAKGICCDQCNAEKVLTERLFMCYQSTINSTKGKKMKNAKESKSQRADRISGTNNGQTLRTRVVPNKKKYNRKNLKKGEDNE